MKAVLGEQNVRWLGDLLARSRPQCTAVRAAVAYADPYPPFVEFLASSPIPVKFYGRLDSTTTGGFDRIRWFLNEAPANVDAYVVDGHAHPKVIWCQGYGAYVGSTHIPRNNFDKSIECGVFYEEEELRAHDLEESLESLFRDLDKRAQRLTQALFDKLMAIDVERRRVAMHVDAIERKHTDLIRARHRPRGERSSAIPPKPR